MRSIDERLFDVAAQGDIPAVRALIEDGADPNAENRPYGNTPLYSACFRDQPAVIRALLEAGADPNRRMTYRSPVDGRVEAGIVPLMVCRSREAADVLLVGGADPNVADSNGSTPLMRVALSAPVAAVERLLAAGADPTAMDNEGRTAADHVRARLDWVNEAYDRLAQPGASRRRAALQKALKTLEDAEHTRRAVER